MDRQKRRVRALHGKWTDSLWTMDMQDSQHFADNESLFNGVFMSKSESSILFNAQKSYEEGLNGDSADPVVAADKVDGDVDDNAAAAAPAAATGVNSGAAVPSTGVAEILPETVPLPVGIDLPEIHHLPSAFCLWKADPRPEHSELYYNFTLFAMMLNELDPDQTSHLPPTDSRLRPDIRCLENGDLEGAAREKNRLEEKQRSARRSIKRQNQVWESVWFHEGTNPATGSHDWIFNTDYWKRDWSEAADIF